MERDGKKYLSGQCILRGLRQGGEVIYIDFFFFPLTLPQNSRKYCCVCFWGYLYFPLVSIMAGPG